MKLYMLVGLPFSGKSEWARKQNVPIVDVDAIRYAIHQSRFNPRFEDLVWFHAKLMVEVLHKAGHTNVILDSTNIHNKPRNGWAQLFNVCYVVFTTPIDQCVQAAIDANKSEYVPIIERLYSEFEMPQNNYVFGDNFNITDSHGNSKLSNDEVSISDKSSPILSGPGEILHSVSSPNTDTTGTAN